MSDGIGLILAESPFLVLINLRYLFYMRVAGSYYATTILEEVTSRSPFILVFIPPTPYVYDL